MSTIEQWRVRAYDENVNMHFQQMTSRLRDAVRFKPGVRGKAKGFDRLDITEAQDKPARGADVEYQDPEHSRRWAIPMPRFVAVLLDDADEARMLHDPKSEYAMTGAAGCNRKIDSLILTAALGTALSGEEAGSTATFDTTNNQIAHGSTGLSIAKLTSAKEILDANECDEEDRHIVVRARQLKNLLDDTTVTSSDYNSVKALVRGEIDTFLGFKFHRTQLVAHASSIASVVAWQKKAIGLAMVKDLRSRISEIPTKHYSDQIYVDFDAGAVRVFEEGVVEIQCWEA